MKKLLPLTLALTALAFSASAQAGTLTKTQMKAVTKIAKKEAKADGETHPGIVEITSGTMGGEVQAMTSSPGITRATGPLADVTDPRTARPWIDSPVYRVKMTGQHFTSHVPTPKRQEDPTGKTLDLIIDAASGRVVSEYIPEPEESAQAEARRSDCERITRPTTCRASSRYPRPARRKAGTSWYQGDRS